MRDSFFSSVDASGEQTYAGGESTDDAALQHVGEDAELPVSGVRQIHNASVDPHKHPLSLKNWPVRPGGEDHKKHLSHGVRC